MREALERIADDESAHAELAWRFVAWALVTWGPAVRDAVRGAFREALARAEALPMPRGPEVGVNEHQWERAGRLTQHAANALAREALAGVLVPCVEALFAERAWAAVKGPMRASVRGLRAALA